MQQVFEYLARFMFATRTQDEWADAFAGVDACVTPVKTFADAAQDPQVAARRALIDTGWVLESGPAPRFSLYGGDTSRRPPNPGEHTLAVRERCPRELAHSERSRPDRHNRSVSGSLTQPAR